MMALQHHVPSRSILDSQGTCSLHCMRRSPVATPPRCVHRQDGTSEASTSAKDYKQNRTRVTWRVAAATAAVSATAVCATFSPTALAWGGGKGGAGGPGGNSGGGADGSGAQGGGDNNGATQGPVVSEDQKKKKGKKIALTLVSFAVTRKAFAKITRDFISKYRDETGDEVSFQLSFGGSGAQARSVMDGLPADIVALALPMDIQKIVERGLVDPAWRSRSPNDGVWGHSVVACVVRRGNPKGITDWEDLARPDVDVICANPKTAGVARWNFLAMWGHVMERGEAAAKAWMIQTFMNIPIQPRDAREASDVFYKQGLGDVLLNYENEVILTNRAVGEAAALPYFVPQKNVQIQAVVSLVDKTLVKKEPEARRAAEAFIDYMFTRPAQEEFAKSGFRSIDKQLLVESHMPAVKQLWTVEGKLGGWIAAQKKFFDRRGILDEVQETVNLAKLELRQQGKAKPLVSHL